VPISARLFCTLVGSVDQVDSTVSAIEVEGVRLRGVGTTVARKPRVIRVKDQHLTTVPEPGCHCIHMKGGQYM
jgi:tRNA U55 pseudouridine synthase TruB